MEDILIDHCIICGGPHTQLAMKIEDYLVTKESFRIAECQNCHFRFVENPPPKDEAHRYYETEEYVEHSDSAEGMINWVYHKARRWMLGFKYSLISHHNQEKKILDFGTGTGYFLNYMKSKDYEVHGVEVSTKAQKFGREKFGLTISHPEDIYRTDFPNDFGVITFWHVLEHVYNPESILKRIHDLLIDQGSLIVALPNYKCFEQSIYGAYWNGYDAPRHLWHFTLDNFRDFAQRCGFKLEKVKLLPLDPFYNCLISESYRKKKWAHILIPFIGFASLWLGWFNKNRASSIVYILSKNNA